MKSSKLNTEMAEKEYNHGKKGTQFVRELSGCMPSRASFCTVFSFAYNLHEA